MEQTMTTGKPYEQIIRFAIPLLLGNLFQQFYNMVDAFIISRSLGMEAFAGVSCTSGLSNLIIGFASGMTAGLAIPLAQSFGAGDEKQVKAHYVHNLAICLCTSILLTVFSLLAAASLFGILRTPKEIFSYAHSYLQVLFTGILASMLYNFFANTLRALGDSKSPLKYLLIASGINIVLDFALIRGTPLGVRGAALATVISQAVSVILCAIKVVRSVKVLSLKGFHGHFQKDIVKGNLAMGIPMAFQSSIISLGVIMIQFATNGMGTIAIASYAVSQKIDGVAVEPLRSLGITMSTYTAQNYGAQKYNRILRGVKQCVIMSLLMSVVLGIVMCFGGRGFASLFVGTEEPEILELSHMFLTIHGVLYMILALLFDYRYTLQGLGNAVIPTVAGLMELAMRAFSAFVLVPRLEFVGASIETPMSWLGALIPVAAAWFLASRRIRQLSTNAAAA